MKILFISVGKSGNELFADAITDYEGRIKRTYSCEWKFIPASKKDGEARKREEGENIIKSLEMSDFVVLLDEKGKEMSSKGLSELIEQTLNMSAKRLVFVIGGAFGVDEKVSERAQKVVSLSKLVFPHLLVRLILVEQVYRALSILKGEKYHHE